MCTFTNVLTFVKGSSFSSLPRSFIFILSLAMTLFASFSLSFLPAVCRIPDSIGREIEKKCQSIYPLKDVCVRKVKILKKPKFDSECPVLSHCVLGGVLQPGANVCVHPSNVHVRTFVCRLSTWCVYGGGTNQCTSKFSTIHHCFYLP